MRRSKEATQKPKKTFTLGMFLLLSLLSGHARAGSLLEISDLSISFKNFLPYSRDPLVTSNGLPDRQMGQEVALNMNFDIARYFYLNNRVHSFTDEKKGGGFGQFRTVGWEFTLGARLMSSLHVSYYHHSQHMLDYSYPFEAYPLQDAVGVTLILYGPEKEKGLLPW
jgi:hypothetical protein